MRRLRIGVNALYLIPGGVGGTEIYLRNLLAALAAIDETNEYVVFTNRETGPDLVPARVNFIHAPQRVAAAFRPWRILWEQTVLPVAAMRWNLDVLLNPGFTSPTLSPCPCVTVFHDMQHRRHPEYFRWFDLPFWRLFLFLSACRSEQLIAVSEATRQDLLHFYPRSARNVHVVAHGVEEEFFGIARRRAHGQPRPVLLCVSTLHRHKNLESLLRCFAAFRRERPEFGLVLAGMHGFHSDAIRAAVAALDLAESVELPGWMPRQALYDLYLEADSFIYPSSFEGFGMPVLEAMAAGLPVACADINPLREVAGEAALFFPPDDEAAMLSAMREVTTNTTLRERLSAAGRSRAGMYSWRRAAEATLRVLCAAGGQRSSSSS